MEVFGAIIRRLSLLVVPVMIGAVFFTESPVSVLVLILADCVARLFFSLRATYTNAPGRLAVYAIVSTVASNL
jgi:hypothetical protein